MLLRMTHHEKVEGIVIKRVNIGEADRLLTIFTKELGKITIKAKGVRKITSKRSSHIELLNRVSLSMVGGKSMYVLTEAQVVDTYDYIKQDLRKIGYAYHICELVNGLLPESQEVPEMYGLMRYCFGTAFKESDLSQMVHRFELKILIMLGFWPEGKALDMVQSTTIIEGILERKLKSRNVLPYLL